MGASHKRGGMDQLKDNKNTGQLEPWKGRRRYSLVQPAGTRKNKNVFQCCDTGGSNHEEVHSSPQKEPFSVSSKRE
jgi:hypothetical protein